MAERLSAIDGSFLRVESADAHMHVAWAATFRVPDGSAPPTLARLRRHISGRLARVPRFRRRLAYPPPGMGEPFWVDDLDFDVARHVLPLGTLGHELDDRRFELLCDDALSSQLDRGRPLWEIRLAPRLTGGRCAIVAKLHHALVDGRSAVEVALYMLGAELVEAYPVVPIAQGHALSIGIFGYLGRLHFGLYADPAAFAQVHELPGALDVALGELVPDLAAAPAPAALSAG